MSERTGPRIRAVPAVESGCMSGPTIGRMVHAERDRCNDSALASADRAIAAARIDDTVRQFEFEHHRAAVARQPVPRENLDPTHRLDHEVRSMVVDCTLDMDSVLFRWLTFSSLAVDA